MTLDSKVYLRNDEGHTFISDETIDLPHDFIMRALLPRRTRRMITYWGIDDKGAYYIIRSSFAHHQKSHGGAKKQSSSLEEPITEAFVCLPLYGKSEKCMVYFFSDFNYFNCDGPKPQSVNPLLLNTLIHDSIKLARMNLLSSFIDHSKRSQEKKFRELYDFTLKAEQDV